MQALINKNKFSIGLVLLILLTTFISQKKITINQFKIKEILIENNKIIKDQELIKNLSFLYNENMIFLNSYEIKKKLGKNSFIKSVRIKKIYPEKIIVTIYEKDPIAILIDKEKKFFLGKKIDLIEYREILKFNSLPVIKGNKTSFQSLFHNLKKISFPIDEVHTFNLFGLNRWDIEMRDKKIIKLPAENYNQNLKNFLDIKKNKNFDKYKIFDYRLKNQLILK